MNDHIMKWFLVYLSIAFLPFIGNAQDIEVKKFEPLEKDQTASLSPRKDINGVTCGLVKVLLKEPGAEFEGSVMGDVQFTGKEYLVYLPNGTKRLGIKHPDYLPTTIVFADYGTKKVVSGITYELKVKTNKKQAKVDNSKKGMAVFNIKPSNAMLLIDGQIADGSGGAYTLSLPYGTHYYTVKLKDFSITNQAVKIDKNAKTIDLDLTEYFAKVTVSCNTRDASISVNNEQKGFGKWTGLIIPGKCTVEVSKDGYHTLSKSFELMDGDSINVDFAELKAITGTLRVENELDNCEVFLNGEKVGTTPWRKELPIGEYKIEIRHNYYNPFIKSISISDGQELLIKEELSQTLLGKLNQYADNGHSRARRMLTDLYRYGSETILKYPYDVPSSSWNNLCYENDSLEIGPDVLNFEKIEKNIMAEIKWAKVVVSENRDMCSSQWLGRESYHLMKCFLIGQGIKQDFSQSLYWAKVGAEEDYGEFLNLWVAWHYCYGRGVEKDTRKALLWLKKYKSEYNSCSGELITKLINDYMCYQIKVDQSFPEVFEPDEKLNIAVLEFINKN